MQTNSITTQAIIEEAGRLFELREVAAGLRLLAEGFPGGVVLSSSFSWEDQAISHVVFSEDLPIDVFTLDTGRLFPETYSTWSATLERYGKPITAFYPDALSLQAYTEKHGPNAFYESVELRKACCHIRKVEPLQRALIGRQVWLTGIRAEHSANRDGLADWEWDEGHRLYKLHPLLHWSTNEVLAFIRNNHVPYNPLHDRGFVSIGCAPCTRAVKAGENFRAGRWWWEAGSQKECGLHVRQ